MRDPFRKYGVRSTRNSKQRNFLIKKLQQAQLEREIMNEVKREWGVVVQVRYSAKRS